MKQLIAMLLLAAAQNTLCFSQTKLPSDSLTLSEAIGLVLARNPSVSQALRTVESAQSAVGVSRSDYYPGASTELSYTRLGPVAEFDIGGTSLPLYPANNYDGHLELRQILYDFSKTSATVDVASSRVSLERDRLSELRRDLAFATVHTFYTDLLLRQSIRVQEELIRSLEEYLAVTQGRLSAGTATEFDVLTVRVRVSAAQTEKIGLEDDLRQQEILYRRLADLPADAEPKFKGLFEAESPGMNFDTLAALAYGRRPDVQTAADGVIAAHLKSELAGKHDSPSISVSLAYGLKNGFMPNLDVLHGNYAANLGLSVPLFDGKKTDYLEEGARADLAAAEEKKRSVEIQVRSEIQQALSSLNAGAEKLQTTKLNVTQAERAAELARVKYDAGVITNLDVLDAQTSLEQAKLADLRALFGYVLSAFDLKRATGERIW